MSRTRTARKLTRREELGVESRRKIVEAAADLMAERGFAGTSIAAVSKRSGLPSGSIYWHFDNKEALLGAVVEEGAQRWFDSLPQSASSSLPVGEHASALLGATAASLEEHPEFLRLLFLIALERREIDEASLAVIRRVRKRALEAIQHLMTGLLEPVAGGRASELAAEFSLLVLCVADGAFLASQIDPETTDLRAIFAQLQRAMTALAREAMEDDR